MLYLAYFGCFFFGLFMLYGCNLFWSCPKSLFMVENSLIESLSAGFFLLAGILALITAVIVKKNKAIPIMFSLAGIILFLEEISYGKDIFMLHKKFPVFLGVRIDALKDFFELYKRYFKAHSHDDEFIALSISFIFILIFFIVKARKFLSRFISGRNGVFLGIAFFLLAFATIRDMHLIKNEDWMLVKPIMIEEYMEMSAGLAFLFLCASNFYDALKNRRMVTSPENKNKEPETVKK